MSVCSISQKRAQLLSVRWMATSASGVIEASAEESKKAEKDQESIQSCTTPDPGYHKTLLVLNSTNESQEVILFPAGNSAGNALIQPIKRAAKPTIPSQLEYEQTEETEELSPAMISMNPAQGRVHNFCKGGSYV